MKKDAAIEINKIWFVRNKSTGLFLKKDFSHDSNILGNCLTFSSLDQAKKFLVNKFGQEFLNNYELIYGYVSFEGLIRYNI